VGIDVKYFQPPSQPRQANCIMHVGTLTNYTKLEPMLWFCEKVLPIVRGRISEAELHLVGRTPTEPFQRLANVFVQGVVDNEIPYLQRGRVFISPQFVGSGIRVKILNAMATSNAIVCTSVACEGIPMRDGTHALIRDDPESFAQAVLSLLQDEEQAQRIGKNARQLAIHHASWPHIAAELESSLSRTIDRADQMARVGLSL
jgi:glycosyltransferase involved in cell wall biosynthesis